MPFGQSLAQWLIRVPNRRDFILRAFGSVPNNDEEAHLTTILELQNQLVLFIRFEKGNADYLELKVQTGQAGDSGMYYERGISSINADYIEQSVRPRRIGESCNIEIPIPVCADLVRVVTKVVGDVTGCSYGARLTIGTA